MAGGSTGQLAVHCGGFCFSAGRLCSTPMFSLTLFSCAHEQLANKKKITTASLLEKALYAGGQENNGSEADTEEASAQDEKQDSEMAVDLKRMDSSRGISQTN